MSDTASILEIEALSKRFATRRSLSDIALRKPASTVTAVDQVSLALPRNRTLGIVGESGSGKSTLAKCIVRLLGPEGGAIRFEGMDISQATGGELKELRRRVQMIYQDPYNSLNPRLKIGEAIIEPALVHGLVTSDGAESRLDELMAQVGLSPDLADRRPKALSGGQRQRVAIARALATKPDVLIADEAVSALDVSIQAQILNLLAELQDSLGLSIVFISHQLSVVAHISHAVAVMYLGRVVEHGPTDEVFARPAHPYTVGLLKAQPGRKEGSIHTAAVKGEIPSPLAIPTGCRFRTRCPLAEEICATVDPPPVEVGAGHQSWCHVLPRTKTHDVTKAA
jgi:oligopeptide/dipeptide ABC transporter ATP-binding protein